MTLRGMWDSTPVSADLDADAFLLGFRVGAYLSVFSKSDNCSIHNYRQPKEMDMVA